MTIQDLIDALESCDPDMEVMVVRTDEESSVTHSLLDLYERHESGKESIFIIEIYL